MSEADAKHRGTKEYFLARYAHPFYRANRRLFGVGYNLTVLGGV